MNFFIILLIITASVTRSFSTADDNSHSSFLHIVEDYYLEDHVSHRQKASSVSSCAQICLRSRPFCRSLNYGRRDGTMVCELNDKGIDIAETPGSSLVPKSGFIFGQLLLTDQDNVYNQSSETGNKAVDGTTFVFTTLGARGETGPTNTSGYVETPLGGKVTLDSGIQIWTVPVTGSYVIKALGASGANGTNASQVLLSWRIGGLVAKIKGTFKLRQGTQLKILVGQEGNRATEFADRPGGGGGGSFVALFDNTPLIIAGGGGGGGAARDHFKDGDPGQVTENGTRCGGMEGAAGQVCDAFTGSVSSFLSAGGGAGFTGNGKGWEHITKGSKSFLNGGTGGTCPVSNGGFGGGGFAFFLNGGGGGYSGGGVVGTSTSGVAGGGGSYNSGTYQNDKTGVNKGDGKVIIKLKT